MDEVARAEDELKKRLDESFASFEADREPPGAAGEPVSTEMLLGDVEADSGEESLYRTAPREMLVKKLRHLNTRFEKLQNDLAEQTQKNDELEEERERRIVEMEQLDRRFELLSQEMERARIELAERKEADADVSATHVESSTVGASTASDVLGRKLELLEAENNLLKKE